MKATIEGLQFHGRIYPRYRAVDYPMETQDGDPLPSRVRIGYQFYVYQPICKQFDLRVGSVVTMWLERQGDVPPNRRGRLVREGE